MQPAKQDTLRVRSADGFELSLPIAGLGGRAYAFAIDWHIRVLLALAWLLAVALSVDWEQVASAAEAIEAGGLDTAHWLLVLPPLVIYFLYHPILEVLMGGRTPGKRMTGLRVVTLSGATPGVGTLLMRNVFRLVDALPVFYLLGMAVVMATRRHVRIGDLAAGTLLVYDRVPEIAKGDVFGAYTGATAPAAEQVALLQELLGRWSGLAPEVRERLGRAMLRRLAPGPAVEAELESGQLRGDALRSQLADLLHGEPGAGRG
jgi:uncharacterized RDD family membrane protein YckC